MKKYEQAIHVYCYSLDKNSTKILLDLENELNKLTVNGENNKIIKFINNIPPIHESK